MLKSFPDKGSSLVQKEKIIEIFTNKSFTVAMKILDSVMSELSLETLNKANKILSKRLR